MDATKTVASLGAGAAIGRSTADWFMGGIGQLPAGTIFGPLTEAAKAELAMCLAAGLAWLATWIHHRLTRKVQPVPPPAPPAPRETTVINP